MNAQDFARGSARAAERHHGMWLQQPAVAWQDALPLGNGWTAALVHGRIAHETVIFNHTRLWMGGNHTELPDISGHLPELRRLLAAGEFDAATRYYWDLLDSAGYKNELQRFHPAFDLNINCELHEPFSAYSRHLDFATAEAVVRWRSGGTDFERRMFVSRADDLFVLRYSASTAGSLSASFALQPHPPDAVESNSAAIPVEFDSSTSGDNLVFEARYVGGDADGGEYGGVATVSSVNGDRRVEEGLVHIDNADEVLVRIKLYAQQPAEQAIPALQRDLQELPDNYRDLFERHAAPHRELFLRLGLDLNGDEGRVCSNEELLQQGSNGDAPTALIERMADYGRYLLICSARSGGLPPNLQGIWNGDWSPPFSAMYTNNENIEMAYWQALPGHLAETTEAFFEFYEAYAEDYRLNARKVYGCRGFFVPHAQTPAHAQPRGSAPHCIYWTAGAGWLAALFYDYYLFTGDREFLEKRAVPFMAEAALFYENFLTEDENGRCHFAPSYSPENSPVLRGRETEMEGMFACTVNATADIAIARELLTNLCDACELLGIKSEEVARWRQLVARMPAYEINEDGAMREWVHPDLLDNYQHRHQSHLYPVFPGLELTRESDADLTRACSVALDKRLSIGLGSQTGWSLAHTANSRARLEEGDDALQALEILIQSCVRPNLFTHHNDWRRMGATMDAGARGNSVFQMDANFGFSAAVLEMLLFSKPGLIKLLPALPSKWLRGRVTGLRCRGGIGVDIDWDVGGQLAVSLHSHTDQVVTVKFPIEIADLKCDSTQVDISPAEEGSSYRRMTLPARATINLSGSMTAHGNSQDS